MCAFVHAASASKLYPPSSMETTLDEQ